ncbi:MAG: UvrB/UvrC motif-containing protein, partial [Chloroflexi bacterium]|nr:UvrB/UvrC motif-containing protein [Chloroflexota bacterium]
IAETQRRRQIQEDYNKEHGITPQGIRKAIKDITERVKVVAETRTPYMAAPIAKEDIARLIKELESQMKIAARNLEFEKAALLRDRIVELRKNLVEDLVTPLTSSQPYSRKGKHHSGKFHPTGAANRKR